MIWEIRNTENTSQTQRLLVPAEGPRVWQTKGFSHREASSPSQAPRPRETLMAQPYLLATWWEIENLPVWDVKLVFTHLENKGPWVLTPDGSRMWRNALLSCEAGSQVRREGGQDTSGNSGSVCLRPSWFSRCLGPPLHLLPSTPRNKSWWRETVQGGRKTRDEVLGEPEERQEAVGMPASASCSGRPRFAGGTAVSSAVISLECVRRWTETVSKLGLPTQAENGSFQTSPSSKSDFCQWFHDISVILKHSSCY